MNKTEKSEEAGLSLFGKIIVVIVFATAMVSSVLYFSDDQSSAKYIAMENYQQQFSRSVTLAHWQWQAEGEPTMIVLVHYDSALSRDGQPLESGRSPLPMSENGFPRVSPSAEGCEKLWRGVLYAPPTVEGFRVFAEYFADSNLADELDDAFCRFRLSVGPQFNYEIASGRVGKLEG